MSTDELQGALDSLFSSDVPEPDARIRKKAPLVPPKDRAGPGAEIERPTRDVEERPAEVGGASAPDADELLAEIEELLEGASEPLLVEMEKPVEGASEPLLVEMEEPLERAGDELSVGIEEPLEPGGDEPPAKVAELLETVGDELPAEAEGHLQPAADELPQEPVSARSVQEIVDRGIAYEGAADRALQTVSAPTGREDEIEDLVGTEDPRTRTDQQALNYLLGIAVIGGGVALLIDALRMYRGVGQLFVYVSYLIGYVFVVGAFLLRRLPSGWRAGILIAVTYVVAFFSIWERGTTGVGPWYLIGIPVLAFLFVSERAGIVAGAANVAVYTTTAVALQWREAPAPLSTQTDLGTLWAVVPSLAFALVTVAIVTAQAMLSRALRQVHDALDHRGTALRESLATGTRLKQELERAEVRLRRQAGHLDLGTEIGRVAAMGLDARAFADRAISQLCEYLQADYVGLYLLDHERAYATLEAVAGVTRDALSPEQHRLRVADDSLLRQCVTTGRIQVLMGVDEIESLSSGALEDPFVLDGMLSAMVLPMVADGEVFGVITVQAYHPALFAHQDVGSLQAIANQVAMGLANAQLESDLGTMLQDMDLLQRYFVRSAWDEFLAPDANGADQWGRPGVEPPEDQELSQVERLRANPRLSALVEEEVSAQSALLLPIALRDQVLSVLGVQRTESDEMPTEDQIALLSRLSEQVKSVLENSRLFAEARARAAHERQAQEISARIRQGLDVETVLRTTALEIGRVLELEDLTIRLTKDQQSEVEG